MSTRESGFTLIEAVTVSAVAMISLGLAAPALTGAMQHYQFNTDVQQLAATIRSARYKAVASNATMRVRLNCPSQGQMRVVQVTGDATIDGAADRCDTAVYPYPGTTPATAGDGPVVLMGTAINYPQNVASIQIGTTGRMVPVTGCPNCTVGSPPFTVSVQDDRNSLQRNITVSATGSLTVESFAHALEESQ
jgi:Tfp pilus assembly protein FimT